MQVNRILPGVTLILSLSTLFCCALPALFVMLGAGATFVSLLGTFPQLIWLSEHKVFIFAIAGACIAINFTIRAWAPRLCPTDPRLALECMKARRLSACILYASMLLYLVGAFFAFAAPLIWG